MLSFKTQLNHFYIKESETNDWKERYHCLFTLLSYYIADFFFIIQFLIMYLVLLFKLVYSLIQFLTDQKQ